MCLTDGDRSQSDRASADAYRKKNKEGKKEGYVLLLLILLLTTHSTHFIYG